MGKAGVKPGTVSLVVAALLLSFASAAEAGSIVQYSAWNDVNKYWDSIPAGVDPDDTSDSLMCWAATVSNVMWHTQWLSDRDGDSTLEPVDDSYHEFLDAFPNETGSGYKGYSHYFDEFWPAYDVDDFFHQEDDDDEILARIEEWMGLDYGLYLSITNDAGTLGHAITAWGFEYDTADADYYTRIAVTDSDDHTTALQWYDLDLRNGHWYLEDYGADVYIRRLDALAQNPVPEPSSLVLVALCGFGLCYLRRRSR